MATSAPEVALPYHEPGIVTILILTSFLLLLNVVNNVMDRITYVGLLGQVFLGIAWGTPGAKWLGRDVETVIVNLGYLGLLLLVYEGRLFYFQAFAAGAALCSTSLGTTFTVMQTSGLSTTRMGVVLTSAAMMDDVVGLVMVQVISNLGAGSGPFSAVTMVRPILVSLAFGLAVPVACRFTILPLTSWLNKWRTENASTILSRLLLQQKTAFIVHTTILVAMITGATYAGTSNLFAAYLTGAAISWWDSDVPHDVRRNSTGAATDAAAAHDQTAGVTIFELYYSQPLRRILKPFFFASIGFSIPITRMFTGSIVWRGFIYTVLMMIGKLACGLWLVRLKTPAWLTWTKTKTANRATPTTPAVSTQDEPPNVEMTPIPNSQSASRPANSSAKIKSRSMSTHQSTQPVKPLSLYPGAILGCAMVARGEIGFLISSLAESNQIFGQEANGPLFLIVTWAIMLCTILGPICVGLMVKRLRALSDKKGEGDDRRDVLGVWGLS